MKHKPVLFLDFDRTLFDTDQFYDWLGEERFSRILDLSAGKIEAPDFRAMIYPDTISFLEQAGEAYRLVLLTYTVNIALQRRKVRGSGIVPFFDDIIMTQGSKGLEAKKYLTRMDASGWSVCTDCAGRAGGEHVFVDDAPENVDDMKTINPEIATVRIDRTPLPSEKLFQVTHEPDLVVRSLSALSAQLFE
jgi:FMN phosphatase YigB (HAD superfamily)